MSTFVGIEVETDPTMLSDEAKAWLVANLPGYDPANADQETFLIEAGAVMGAVIRDMVADVPAAIFRKYGTDVIGLPVIDDAPAACTVTVTAVDNAGYQIDQGTLWTVHATGDTGYPFQSIAPVIIPPGSTTATVPLVQVLSDGQGGAEANGLTSVDLYDSRAFIASTVMTSAPANGTDAESDDDYLNRLRRRLQLLSPRPILPADFAVLAEDVAGVARALAVNLYNPAVPGTPQDRTVSVASIDVTGAAVGTGVKSAVAAYLQAQRELNFQVFAIDPTYTMLAIAVSGVATTGYDPTDVATAVQAAILAYTSPANWGQPAEGDQRSWVNQPVVRFLEVAAVANSVPGFDYITSLTLNGSAADVTLTGVAPLPSLASTCTATVTAP